MTKPADPRATYDDLVDELTATAQATASQMMGMPCLKSNGKMFAGFRHGAMVFKLPGETHAQALGLAGARLFDPGGNGQPFREWVEVPAEHAERWPKLARAALEYVAQAPAAARPARGRKRG